jgi:hypothetical protein
VHPLLGHPGSEGQTPLQYFNLAMENVLKGLPDKISCPYIIHKCTSNVHNVLITFKLRDRGDEIGFHINPCYHTWYAFFFSPSFSPFSPHDLWLEWGIFFYSRDPSLMSLIDSQLFVKFSKMVQRLFADAIYDTIWLMNIHEQK